MRFRAYMTYASYLYLPYIVKTFQRNTNLELASPDNIPFQRIMS